MDDDVLRPPHFPCLLRCLIALAFVCGPRQTMASDLPDEARNVEVEDLHDGLLNPEADDLDGKAREPETDGFVDDTPRTAANEEGRAQDDSEARDTRMKDAGPLELKADNIKVLGPVKKILATGDVSLSWRDWLFFGSAGELDPERGTLTLEGPLRFATDSFAIVGSEATFDFEARTGTIVNGRLELPDHRLDVSAERVAWGPSLGLMLIGPTLRFCGCPTPAPATDSQGIAPDVGCGPLWRLTATQARLEPPRGHARRNANSAGSPASQGAPDHIRLERGVLRFMEVPIFYLPRGTFPLRPDTYSGPLAPRLRHDQDGFVITLPAVLRLDSGNVFRFGLTWNQARGLMPDLRYDYGARSSMFGHVAASYLYDLSSTEGAATPQHRWALSWQHKDVEAQHIRTFVHLEEVSDATYLRDFGLTLEDRSLEFLTTRARAELLRGRSETLLSVNHFTGLSENSIPELGYLPELFFALENRRWYGRWGMLHADGQVHAFHQASLAPLEPSSTTTSSAANTTYGDFSPTLRWARPWGRVLWSEATLGYRGLVSVRGLESETEPVPASGTEPGTESETESGTESGPASSTGDPLQWGGQQRVSGTAGLSTSLARTYRREGRTLEKIQHRLEPSLRLDYDFWYDTSAGFVAPVGEPSGQVRRVGLFFTQRLLGQSVSNEGVRRLELGALRLGMGRNLNTSSRRFSDLELALETYSPARLHLVALVDPYDGTLSQAFLSSQINGHGVRLEVSYGFLNGEGTVLPPDGDPELPGTSGSELTLEARFQLDPLTSILWGARRFGQGWSFETRSRVNLDGGISLTSQRLALRYQPRCGCFGASLFLELDQDRSAPDIRASFSPVGSLP